MADYTHITNLIGGEVIRIKERKPPEEWEHRLEDLYQFLMEQGRNVLMEKLRAAQERGEIT
jgi:hypothetical protein